jgi:hypothetical protein
METQGPVSHDGQRQSICITAAKIFSPRTFRQPAEKGIDALYGFKST